VDGTGLRRLTKNRKADDFAPTWTPDGRIVFHSNRGGLYVMNRDGTGVRRFVVERK
jgi:Tol biopolymer transport system component